MRAGAECAKVGIAQAGVDRQRRGYIPMVIGMEGGFHCLLALHPEGSYQRFIAVEEVGTGIQIVVQATEAEVHGVVAGGISGEIAPEVGLADGEGEGIGLGGVDGIARCVAVMVVARR